MQKKSVMQDITSLTMVFTEEDRVVIKFLRQNKGYSARRLVKEFSLKIGGLRKLRKKIDETGLDRLLSCPTAVGEEPSELMRTLCL